MAAPLSIRVGMELRRRIARIARRKNVSPAAWMRQAFEEKAEREEQELSPYERMKDFIGIINSGDPHFSEDIGRKFAKMLRERRSRS